MLTIEANAALLSCDKVPRGRLFEAGARGGGEMDQVRKGLFWTLERVQIR